MGYQKKHVLALVLCFFESAGFSGILFGWASLVYVYKKDGIFAHLCSNEILAHINGHTPVNATSQNDSFIYQNRSTTSLNMIVGLDGPDDTSPLLVRSPPGGHYIGCPEQDNMLSQVFTVSIACFGFMSFPMGYIFDKVGLRVIRSAAVVCAISGYLLLGSAEKGVLSWLVFPGGIFTVISMSILIITNTHVASLAGPLSSSVATIYCGGVNMSAVVLLVIKHLCEKGVRRIYPFIFMACLWVIVIFTTWFLLPKHKVTIRELKNGKGREEGKALTKSNESHPSSGNASRTKNRKSFFSVACSCDYLLLLIWFPALHLRIQGFLASFNLWITSIVDGDTEQVSFFTNVLGYVQLTSICIAPISGFLMDYRRKAYIDKGQAGGGMQAQAAVPSLAITSLLAIALTVAILSSATAAIYAAIIFSELVRSFLYATGNTFIFLAFPVQHFGKLFGLAYALNGSAVLLQYPSILWIESSDSFTQVNILMLVLSVLTCIHPLSLFIKHKYKRRHSYQQAKSLDENEAIQMEDLKVQVTS